MTTPTPLEIADRMTDAISALVKIKIENAEKVKESNCSLDTWDRHRERSCEDELRKAGEN
jgi:cell division ATPase FtsA